MLFREVTKHRLITRGNSCVAISWSLRQERGHDFVTNNSNTTNNNNQILLSILRGCVCFTCDQVRPWSLELLRVFLFRNYIKITFDLHHWLKWFHCCHGE